jgi:hypothetical protein
MKRHLVPFVALLAVAGCRSVDSQYTATPHGIAAAMAGEWNAVGQVDEYLLFKPDDGAPKTGRFGGLGHFNRYEIKSGLSLGSHAQVALSAAADESEMVIDADVSGDGRTLTAKIPAGAGKGAVVRTYRKAQ